MPSKSVCVKPVCKKMLFWHFRSSTFVRLIAIGRGLTRPNFAFSEGGPALQALAAAAPGGKLKTNAHGQARSVRDSVARFSAHPIRRSSRWGLDLKGFHLLINVLVPFFEDPIPQT